MTRLNEKFTEVKKAGNNQHYSTISIRAPIELASMIDTVSVATQEAVLNLLTSDLSVNLANYLLEDANNMTLIEQTLQEAYAEHADELADMITGSCVDILIDTKIIQLYGRRFGINTDMLKQKILKQKKDVTNYSEAI